MYDSGCIKIVMGIASVLNFNQRSNLMAFKVS